MRNTKTDCREEETRNLIAMKKENKNKTQGRTTTKTDYIIKEMRKHNAKTNAQENILQ